MTITVQQGKQGEQSVSAKNYYKWDIPMQRPTDEGESTAKHLWCFFRKPNNQCKKKNCKDVSL